MNDKQIIILKAFEDELNKIAAWTEHGRIREEGKAKAYKDLADAYRKAAKEDPGLNIMKGTFLDAPLMEIAARHEAYKSKQEDFNNLLPFVPFVGWGKRGRKALEEIMKEKNK